MTDLSADSRFAIVIHGGAGTTAKADMTSENEAEIRATLQASVQAGYKTLLAGKSSAEAVIAAINVMEDSPLQQ
ncbi:isoaspartyl peptidase/L-asparaginase [Pseudomonadota bacterium]